MKKKGKIRVIQAPAHLPGIWAAIAKSIGDDYKLPPTVIFQSRALINPKAANDS